MDAAPVAALDLPLKVLVWVDDEGEVWMTNISGEWLVERHGIPEGLAHALSATDVLTRRIAESSDD
jgi:uncharacterized protein (DUF302 family)